MNCALWLNKQKVQQASEIPGNLDVASLRGYFLAGSLVEWLRENGGKMYADKLSKLSPDDPELNQKIAAVFGGKPVRSKSLPTAAPEDTVQQCGNLPQGSGIAASFRLPPGSAPAYAGSGSFTAGELSSLRLSSLQFSSLRSSSLQLSSFREFLLNYGTSSFGSFSIGSFSQWEWLFRLFGGYGSFYMGSFSSFREWEWEWFFRLFGGGGSFYIGSFSSFHEWEWEWFFRLFGGGGSFYIGSFSSFHEWEWEWLLRLFGGYGSFSASSFGLFGSFGSFNAFADPAQFPFLDEYDRIMLETLVRCPLDRFGYGVHNI